MPVICFANRASGGEASVAQPHYHQASQPASLAQTRLSFLGGGIAVGPRVGVVGIVGASLPTLSMACCYSSILTGRQLGLSLFTTSPRSIDGWPAGFFVCLFFSRFSWFCSQVS